MRQKRLFLGVLFILGVLTLVYILQAQGLLMSFEEIRDQRGEIETFLMQDPLLGILIFAAIYITAVALSLPIATPLTVLSGFLFGSILGTGVVAVAATTGATIIFILARFFFREYFTEKFGNSVERVNRELTDNGFRDVLLLRLTPLVPFALINVATALTSVRIRDYVLATLIGTLPFTFVYVHAGSRLAELNSLSDVLSFQTLLAVSLVVVAAAVPLIIRRRKSPRHLADHESDHQQPQE